MRGGWRRMACDAIEHPLRRVHIQKGLFLATERYGVLNYAARFALPSRCRAFARRYEVGLWGLSLVPFNASCSASFAYQNITTFGVCPVQVAHPLWGYAACRRICSLAGSKTETWLTSSNVRTAEIRIRLLHLNVGDFNLREVLCIHQHSALCQREGRARGQTFGAKASAPKKHETRQTHTRCCILCLHPKRDLRAAGKAKSLAYCARFTHAAAQAACGGAAPASVLHTCELPGQRRVWEQDERDNHEPFT